MITMTQSAVPVSKIESSSLSTTSSALLMWGAAAILAASVQTLVGPWSVGAGAVLTAAAVAVAAWGYGKLRGNRMTFSHALGLGVVWFVLAILTEMIVTTQLGHGWYGLLGSPEHPFVRNVLFLAWIFTPVVFAREEEEV